MLGFSSGNGHPFSFSAIINGYDRVHFSQSGWPGIFNYLEKANPSEVGLEGMEITHIWTQEASLSQQISRACRIQNVVSSPEKMLQDVDAIIIARDDFETHYPLAQPFLNAGLSVFIDKPLTIETRELEYFRPFLTAGKLMSTSGLRYCTELDKFRRNKEDMIGNLITVQCAVVNDWCKYGIHMIDAIQGVYPELQYKSIKKLSSKADSYDIKCNNGVNINIHCLGRDAPVFFLAFIGTKGVAEFRIIDNFGAFRRTMLQFQNQLSCGEPSISPELTISAMELLKVGNNARVGEKIELGMLGQ